MLVTFLHLAMHAKRKFMSLGFQKQKKKSLVDACAQNVLLHCCLIRNCSAVRQLCEVHYASTTPCRVRRRHVIADARGRLTFIFFFSFSILLSFSTRARAHNGSLAAYGNILLRVYAFIFPTQKTAQQSDSRSKDQHFTKAD